MSETTSVCSTDSGQGVKDSNEFPRLERFLHQLGYEPRTSHGAIEIRYEGGHVVNVDTTERRRRVKE